MQVKYSTLDSYTKNRYILNMITEMYVRSLKSIYADNGLLQETLIEIRPLLGNNGSSRFAYPPSPIPITKFGGGFQSLPPIGTRCLVHERPNEMYDQILTYLPLNDHLGTTGLLSAKELDPGAYALKIGTATPIGLKATPEGKFTLYSGQTSLSLDAKTKSVDIDSDSFTVKSYGDSLRFNYSPVNYNTLLKDTHEFTLAVSRLFDYTGYMWSDTLIDTENTSKLPVTVYSDKAIMKMGHISLDGSYPKAKSILTHVYQLETRQNTGANGINKDTMYINRIGYQKENNKFGLETVYPAGTIFEQYAKRNSLNSLSTWLYRYGKQEEDVLGSELEFTKGEIFRNQIYEELVGIWGDPVLNTLAKGKGWAYKTINTQATQQYTESFGKTPNLLLTFQNSFYRKHIHNYEEHTIATENTPTGIEYTTWLGGKSANLLFGDVLSETTIKSMTSGNVDMQYTESLLKSKTFVMNLEDAAMNKYTITIGNGMDGDVNGINIKVKAGAKTSKISIDVATGDIYIDPGTNAGQGSVYIGDSSNKLNGQALVTESWVKTIFDNHMHPTAAQGPPSVPIKMPLLNDVNSSKAHVTYVLKSE